MRVNYKPLFIRELNKWDAENPAIRDSIFRLVQASASNPFRGLGDPRVVKKLGRGVWGRHIFDHHFLIYILERGSVTMYSCRAITDEESAA